MSDGAVMRNDKKKRGLSMAARRAVTGYLFIAPFLIGFFLFVFRPLVNSAWMSFNNVTINPKGGLIYKFVGLNNFIFSLFKDTLFNTNLLPTIKDLTVDGVAVMVFSMFAAIMLNRKMPGRAVFRVIMFLPVIIASGVVYRLTSQNAYSGVVLGSVALQSGSAQASISGVLKSFLLGSFANFSLVSTFLSTIDHIYVIVMKSAIQTVIFLSALQVIPKDMYEAAEIEGCTKWESFWKITFPMISPMILVAWIYTLVDGFMAPDHYLLYHITTDVMFKNMAYGLASAMAWIYTVCVTVIIGVTALLISRAVYYYD